MTTRSKRASSCGLLLSFLLHPVLPDATISEGDRQHIAWSYSFASADDASEITLTGSNDQTIALDGSYDVSIALTGSKGN